MPTINEIKSQKVVVASVGNFADSLQKIAASRMVRLRRLVMNSRRFVDEATIILRELELERTKKIKRELGIEKSTFENQKKKDQEAEKLKTAIIVVSSTQGLAGSYNTEITKKLDIILPEHKTAEYFVIGSKGQAYFAKNAKKYDIKYYPYDIPEDVSIEDLRPLVSMFYHYDQIFIVYSKFINTATRDVVFIELAVPHVEAEEIKKEQDEGKFIFEPSVEELIQSVTTNLRSALFRQQILDSKLALYTAQMLAMKTAADNAVDLLKELQMQYNKARRKLIDKKIQEVQAGRALWAGEE